MRQPTIQGALDVIVPEDFQFAALDEAMEPLFEECLPAPSGPADAAQSVVHRLLHWHAAAQRQQKIPVFDRHRIVAARSSKRASHFFVAVPYHSPESTVQALQWVAKCLNVLLNNPNAPAQGLFPIDEQFELLLKRLRGFGLAGTNNFHLLHASHALDVPVRPLLPGTYCFGYGAHARWLNSTQTDQTSAMGVQITGSKSKTAHILRLAGIPVPLHSLARDEQHALQSAQQLGYPVVIKPDDREQGVGVGSGLQDEAAVVAAYRAALSHSRNILVEKHFAGEDYRLTVLKDQVVKILHRRAGGVFGDGVRTIGELVKVQQDTPRFKKALRQTGKPLLELDGEALGLMLENGVTPDTVPARGDFVAMRRKNNISAGGIQALVPVEHAHPDNIALAVRATHAVQLDVCGVDLLLPDISKSWLETGAVIIEMNSKPQIGYALAPEVYALVLRELLGGDGRVPVHLLLCATESSRPSAAQAHDLMRASDCNGLATQQGVWVNGRQVSEATDAFGAAQILLLDKAVTGALCIMTADEVLRDGLPADRFERVRVLAHPSASENEKRILGRSLAFLNAARVGIAATAPG